MSKDILIAFTQPDWLQFLKDHQNEMMTVTIWAAFGFKNKAEAAAVALLHEFNERNKELMLF